jgi:hypothetical protein
VLLFDGLKFGDAATQIVKLFLQTFDIGSALRVVFIFHADQIP